jgi:hypothetical protein
MNYSPWNSLEPLFSLRYGDGFILLGIVEIYVFFKRESIL